MSRTHHISRAAGVSSGSGARLVQPPAGDVGVASEPQVTSLEPLTVRIPTAMKLTGIGRSKLYELIASGDIEIVKVGTATLVTMASLKRLAERGARPQPWGRR